MGKAKLFGLVVDRLGGPGGGPITHDVAVGFGRPAREVLLERLER